MARGGYRPGAGRPKKGMGVEDVSAEARKERLTPLEYMLMVINDDGAEKDRRDRLAIAAAPYVHGRAVDAEQTKGEQRQARAKEAAERIMARTPPKLVVNNA